MSDFSSAESNNLWSKETCLKSLTEVSSLFGFRKHFTHHHSVYEELYPCLFDLDFNFSAPKIIVVLGGRTPVGIRLVELLKRNNITYIEIQGQLQFNLEDPFIYRILRRLRPGLIVVDLLTYYDSKIAKLVCQYLNAFPIIRLVQNATESGPCLDIEVPSIFGSSYEEENCLSTKWRSLLLKGENIECDGQNEYALAWDVAYSVYDNCRQFLALGYKPVKLFNYSFPLYREKYLSKAIDEAFLATSDGNEVTNVLIQMKEELHIDLEHPYVSHVTTVSDEPRIVGSYQTALNVAGARIVQFPLISLEFICVFLSKTGRQFEDIFQVPVAIKPYLKVVTLPYEKVYEINNMTKTSHYPEYFIRNIGVQKANGTYIFVGSSDVIVPLSFYCAAERHMFSPLSLMRSIREPHDPSSNVSIGPLYSSVYWLPTDLGYGPLTHGVISFACGDFQGAHRRIWQELNGYIQGKEVFHVDTVFMVDAASFYTPILIRFLPGETHVTHEKVSHKTPHVTWVYPLHFPWLSNGVMSKFLYKRNVLTPGT